MSARAVRKSTLAARKKKEECKSPCAFLKGTPPGQRCSGGGLTIVAIDYDTRKRALTYAYETGSPTVCRGAKAEAVFRFVLSHLLDLVREGVDTATLTIDGVAQDLSPEVAGSA